MKNFIVIIDGPMGAGKSTVAELLSKKLKRTAVINSDKIKWFISDFKRGKRDNTITRAVLMEMCEEYLRQGINLVIPQGFWSAKKTPTLSLLKFMRLSKKMKASLYLFHLDAPHAVLYERIKTRTQINQWKRKPVAKSRYERNIRNWKKYRYALGKSFETHNTSAKEIAAEILKAIIEKKYIIR